jgi:hypothetical protein
MTTVAPVKPKELPPGVYWYVVPDDAAQICEKRADEDFVRFTNGARQTWVREGERFEGPLQPPSL